MGTPLCLICLKMRPVCLNRIKKNKPSIVPNPLKKRKLGNYVFLIRVKRRDEQYSLI
jgi:hypothetical protein